MGIYAFLILLLTVRVNCVDDLKIQILDYTLAGPPNLTYLGYDDCVWELRNTITGNTIGAESDGHQIKLDHGTAHTNAKCVVNGTLLLKLFISAIDYIPAPENITLNTATNTIHWNHVFQPSDLPLDFKLIHNYNIFYLVHGNDGIRAPVNVPGDRNYLKFDDESIVMNGCEEQNFFVQTIINNRVSVNSSVVSGNLSVVPVFSRISAEIALLMEYIILRVSFELSREQCQGMTLTAFIVHFEGLPTYKHNVTTLDVENGSINLTLPLNATMLNVCSLNGVIFGSNDVGNSTTEGITLSNDCKPVPSSAIKPSTTSTLRLPSPTATLTTDTDTTPAKSNIAVIIIAPVVLIQLTIFAVVLTVIILILKWKRNKKHCVHLNQVSAKEILNEKPVNYTQVTPTPRPEEQKPNVIDIKVNYETVDHLKTEELRQEKETFRTANPELFKEPQTVSKNPQEVGLSVQLHLEPLMEVLYPIRAKWFNLGMHLNLSENFLDETETNIEMDKECLSEMLKNWLQYHEPSMKVLNHALSQIDHQPITFDVTIQGFMVASEEGGM